MSIFEMLTAALLLGAAFFCGANFAKKFDKEKELAIKNALRDQFTRLRYGLDADDAQYNHH